MTAFVCAKHKIEAVMICDGKRGGKNIATLHRCPACADEFRKKVLQAKREFETCQR